MDPTHISGISQEIDGKMFIFWVNLGMWPLQSIVSEKQALCWGFQHHIYGISQEIDGKTFIFQSKPRHVTPQVNRLRKMSPVLMVPTHIYGIFKEIDGKMFNFWCKPRHLTPEINCLRKTILVLRVSIHISGFSTGDRWENSSFSWVHISMWPLKSIISEKRSLFWWFQHTFLVILKI